MRSLTPTLLAALKESTVDPRWKVVLTKDGETTLTYEKDRIRYAQHKGGESNQALQLLLDNSDLALRDKQLEGYKGIYSTGAVTANGEEYSPEAPLWVITQQLFSLQSGDLYCVLNLGGIMNLLGLDEASAVYEPASGDTRTIKDFLIEILSLTDTGSETDVEQATGGSDMPLHSGVRYKAGQKLTISDRNVTKIALKLKKVGSPTGNITFEIRSLLYGVLVYKVWGDAGDLTTSYAWAEVTLDTPLNVEDEVRIVCDYTDGDSSNYVDVEYSSSSVLGSEELTEIYIGAWTDQASYDCVYRYSYSTTPITVFSHCVPVGVVFDSEDDLIDSLTPQDRLRIHKGQTRKALVEELLGWTGCVWRAEDDGSIHIFVPKQETSTIWVATTAYSLLDLRIPTTANGYVYVCTTAGTSGSSEPTWATGIGDTIVDGTVVWTVAYDFEYELTADEKTRHTFYDKSYNRRLVMPSHITVESRGTDSPSYSGTAQTSDHSGRPTNLQKQHFVPMRLASNAQAASIATVLIAKLVRDAETGSASVPLNAGQEVHDFVNFIDDREGVSRNGVIRELVKTCKADDVGGDTFKMQVRFGLVANEAKLGIYPTTTAPINLEMNFQLLVDQMMFMQEVIDTLWGNFNALSGNQDLIISRLEQMKEYILVAELYGYVRMRIPSGTDMYG